MSRRVLIGGGTGFIGSTLKQFLKNRGYVVTVISRTPGKNRLTWDDIAKSGIPDDTFAAVNVAGENVLNPVRRFNDDFKNEIFDSRIKTTRILANAIREAKTKPEAFICMSGVGIYKPDKVKTYDENTDVGESYDIISKLVHEWEEASETTPDVRKVILRTGVVLGRGGGLIQRVYLQFYFGIGSWFGSGDQFFPWIHIHDLCRLIIFSIENNRVNGVVNAVAPEIVTNKTFAKTFAGAMNRPALLPTLGIVCKLIFGKERAVMILEGQKIVPLKAKEYEFPYLYPTLQKACVEMAPFNYNVPSLTY